MTDEEFDKHANLLYSRVNDFGSEVAYSIGCIVGTIVKYKKEIKELKGDLNICQLQVDAKHTCITSKRERELEEELEKAADMIRFLINEGKK